MPRETYRPAARILSLCLVACFSATAAAQPRVVVQEIQAARNPRLQVTPDGKLAWLIAGVNEHIVQIFDLETKAVLRQFYLPERIEFSSLDSKSRTLAVSTRSAIHLGRLTDDGLEEILPGVHGAVLLDEGAKLLAVLGNVPDPKRKDPIRHFFMNERTLGIFDLAKKEWRHVQRTPIVSPWLEAYSGEGGTALLFRDGAVLAGGVGGTLGSMIPVTFNVDAHLDLKTGKTRITTGPSARFGKIIDPPAKDKEPPEPPEGYEGVDLKHVATYAHPAPLTKAHDAGGAAVRKLWDDKTLEPFRLADAVHDARPMPFAADADRVRIAVRRYQRSDAVSGLHVAILSLTRDGKLGLGPATKAGENPFVRGALSSYRIQYSHTELNDLITGQPLLPPHVFKVEKHHKDVYFLPTGTLVQEKDHLAFYKPARAKPEWTRKGPPRRWIDAQVDAAGAAVALTCGEEPILAEILRLADGKVLGTVPRPKDMTDNYMSMALSRDGKRLGVMKREELRVFDVGAGKEIDSHIVKEDTYGRSLQSWSGGWLVSSEARAQIFDDAARKWTTIIPFRSVGDLQEVDTPKGKRFVLQNYDGACCLADPATGKILSRWMAAEYGHVTARWNAVFAAGKAILRPTGWTAALEFVDLRDGRVVLTIHNVPVDKGLGFIAYTPDGWWDATPGAERHVAVFDKGVRRDEKARNERRNAKMIEERLVELWR
ncbi:MAG: hypothetical protein U0793_11675 [Gemmataceae bacterium]